MSNRITNFFLIAGSDVVARGFFFAFSVLVANQLSPTTFGDYTLAIALGIWLSSLADAGLTAHGTKLLSMGKDPSSVVGRVTGTRVTLVAVISLVFVLLMFQLPLSHSERSTYLSVVLFVLATAIFPAWISRADRDYKSYMLSYVIVAACGLFSLILFLSGFLGGTSFSAILLRNLAWFLGAFFALIIILRKTGISIKLSFDYMLLSKTLPLGAAAILYSLIPLAPQLIMRMHDWRQELGLYGALWQIQQVLVVLAGVISLQLLPTYTRHLTYKSDGDSSSYVIRYLLIVSFFALIVMLVYRLLGDVVIESIFGAKFSNASIYIEPFSYAIFAVFVRLTADTILIAHGQYRVLLRSGLLVVFVTLPYASFASSGVELAWLYMCGESLLAIINVFFAVYYSVKKVHQNELG